MKILVRVCISFLLILIALILIWLIKTMKIQEFSTSYFVLSAGSSIGLTVGIGLLLAILYQFTINEKKRRKERIITPEYVEKRLEEKTKGGNLEYLEGALIFEAGEFIAWAKMRGERGKLDEYGGYIVYSAILEGLKRRIKNVFEDYPQLRDKSYLLHILEDVHPAYSDKVLKPIGELAELYKSQGLNFIERKGLKSLASIIKKYVK